MKLASLGLLASLLALVCSPLVAGDVNGDGFETVLVPISLPPLQGLDGAYGSKWAGELWAHNASEEPLQSFQPRGPCFFPPCPVELPPSQFRFVAGIASNGHDGGALLHIPESIAPQVFLNARLLELTRNSQPTGVEIPIVREEDFFASPVVLLAVPVGPGVRSALRIYDPRLATTGDSSVLIELLDEQGSVWGSTALPLGYGPFPIQHTTAGLPLWPAVARILDLTATFPQLQELERFHVRITPLTPGMLFWPIVSVTDNVTQHVLIISASKS